MYTIIVNNWRWVIKSDCFHDFLPHSLYLYVHILNIYYFEKFL